MSEESKQYLICNPCPAGFYCPTPNVSPIKCPLGTSTNGLLSQLACQSCTLGMYTVGTGSVSCSACPVGYYCPDPASSPVKCSIGFISLGGVVPLNCTLCAAGTQSNAANSACIACASGYSCGSPILGPQACPAGTYAISQNSTACLSCPGGYYCPLATSSPISCPTGYFSSSAGVVNCTACPPGYSCGDKYFSI